VNLETGDDRWVVKLDGRLTASPVISRGVVYVTSEAGELKAVRLTDGRVLFEDRFDVGVQATPLVLDGALFVPLLDGRVRCYR
jgi:outer membrane protein assembly factor BamB